MLFIGNRFRDTASSVSWTGNRSAGAIAPAVEDSVSRNDAIQRKRSLCQENAVLLMVQWLGVTVAMPTVCSSTLALPTSVVFFFAFSRLRLGVTFRG